MSIKRMVVICISACLLLAGVSCKNTDSAQSSSAPVSSGETSTVSMESSSPAESEVSRDQVSSTVSSGSVSSKTGSTAKSSAAASSKAPAAEDDERNYKLKVSDFVPDKSVWATRYLNEGFEAYTDFGRNGTNQYMAKAIVQKTIEKKKLGSLYYAAFDGEKSVAGEWGYTFLNLNGLYDGSGLKIEGAGWKSYTPSSRKDAVARMKNWIFTQYTKAPYNLSPGSKGMGSMNGHCHYQHYAAEWGFDYIGAEIGENIASSQPHMAFTRGAARQYGKLSFLYFSNWFEGKIGTWEEFNSWEGWGDKNCGHSLNLLKRSFIMSYMGGMSSFTFEAGARLAMLGPSYLDKDGLAELSPYGKTMQELVAFSTKNPNMGINYTPIGLVLDYYHGISNFTNLNTSKKSHDKAFGYFANTPGDNMTWNLFKLWYPGSGLFGGDSFSQYGTPPEEKYQVNTPYGDTYDVLLQNASQKVLNSYPCLLLSGDIKLSSVEAKRYVEYVKQGGTLILNKAYLTYFPEYKISYNGGNRQDIKVGKGTVIVYGPDYSVQQLDGILREQLAKFVPFTFSKDVEYLVNVKNGSLIVTLINNSGVTKQPYQPEQADPSKAVSLTVKYTGKLQIQKVKELYRGTTESVSNNGVNVTLGPGEYKVLEFVFG